MSEQLVNNINETNQLIFHEPWIAEMKARARADFMQKGLPTRHDEDWKYSEPSAFIKQDFRLSSDKANIMIEDMPPGVLVVPLKEAIAKHADKLLPYLGKIMQPAHGFHALNTALFQEGFLIYVPEGIKIEAPLSLKHTEVTVGEMRCIRHVVIAEPNSELNLIESYTQTLDKPYFTSVITEIALAEHAKVSYTLLQHEGSEAFHVSDVFVKQAQNSRFESHSISLGAGFARSDIHIALTEPGASCLMNGIYLPKNKQHIDHHTTVEHLVEHCVSEQDYKGIMSDASRAVFNGKVKVSEGAFKTEAKQYNKNILLSKHAEVDTKPELQIFADDVVCAHGATVGALDEEALFYLASRGLEKPVAERYLIQAFLADNLRHMKLSGIEEQVLKHLISHMERI